MDPGKVVNKEPRKPDLIISLQGLDTGTLLANWQWLVPQDFQPIHLSKFGHWFFASPDGRVHHLNLIEGNLLQVAKSRPQFDAMKEDEQIRNDWFLAGFVLQCDSEGLLLKADECYGWRVHPMIGGKVEFENIQVFPVAAYQNLVAQLLQQRNNPRPDDPVALMAALPAKELISNSLPALPKAPKERTKTTRKRQVTPGKQRQRR